MNDLVDMDTQEKPPYCKTDFNDDGKVDDIDLNIFLLTIGKVDWTLLPAFCICDTDGNDHDIDGEYLDVLATEFGRSDCQQR